MALTVASTILPRAEQCVLVHFKTPENFISVGERRDMISSCAMPSNKKNASHSEHDYAVGDRVKVNLHLLLGTPANYLVVALRFLALLFLLRDCVVRAIQGPIGLELIHTVKPLLAVSPLHRYPSRRKREWEERNPTGQG